jgi:hypothetical protein
MDVLTFISNLVDSLSWPLSLAFVVFVLRKHLGKLLTDNRALKLKFKDFEVNFEKTIDAVSKSTENVARAENIAIEEVEVPRLQSLAELSPRAAILESWIEFEEIIFALLKQSGESLTRPGGVYGRTIKRSVSEAIYILTEQGVLGSQFLELISELQELRNRAVHATDDDFTLRTTERYMRSVQALRILIEKLAIKRLQPIGKSGSG